MLSILKNRKNFKDLKKNLKVFKIGKNFEWGGHLLAGQNICIPDL